MKLLSILLFQAAITAPPIGAIRDGSGRVAVVRGLPGNFVVAAEVSEPVLGYGNSGVDWAAKFESEWRTSGRRGVSVPAGPALFAFDRAGRASLAYFESAGTVVRLDSGVALALPGRIESIAVGDGGVVRAIENRDGVRYEVRIEPVGGRSEVAMNDVTGPAFLDAFGDSVFLAGDAAMIRHPNGVELRLELPSRVESMELMGDGLLHLRPGLALRYRAGGERLYRLPGRAQ